MYLVTYEINRDISYGVSTDIGVIGLFETKEEAEKFIKEKEKSIKQDLELFYKLGKIYRSLENEFYENTRQNIDWTTFETKKSEYIKANMDPKLYSDFEKLENSFSNFNISVSYLKDYYFSFEIKEIYLGENNIYLGGAYYEE